MADDAHLIDRRIALAREWDDLVDQVRRLDGFEDFLRPPPLAGLLEAASAGPVVIVNVSRWRCDALVVTPAGVNVVPLPDLTAADVAERTTAYLGALQSVPAGADQTYSERLAARRAVLERREEKMRTTMEWLWDVVAEPVLTALGIVGPPSGAPAPRVWWCPTGLLSLLPLHGAGYHAAGDGRTTLDRVVSSYTPTLRALREARQPRTSPGSGVLFVGVPDADDLVQLSDDVAREKAVLEAAFPAGMTVVEGPRATTATVAAELATHPWVHVSCHGYQDLYNPSRAGLLLADGTLTIPAISARRYAGEFAFLSACMTATGGVNLPDEAITLAAALSYTGYRHVVATLWSVHPATAARVTEAVYPRLTAEGVFRPDEAARALHEAVLALRAGGTRMDEWLPFTHTGP
jgi:hypothetical protein